MELPRREGSRPRTTPTNPHEQLEQNAPEALQNALWERMTSLPATEGRHSGIAPPGSRALWMQGERRSPVAFMVGREFVHLHPRYDGSLHLVLDPESCAIAKSAGWAERHPLAGQFGPSTTVMVYGPRDQAELDVVWQIICQSYRFACGEVPLPDDYGDETTG